MKAKILLEKEIRTFRHEAITKFNSPLGFAKKHLDNPSEEQLKKNLDRWEMFVRNVSLDKKD